MLIFWFKVFWFLSNIKILWILFTDVFLSKTQKVVIDKFWYEYKLISLIIIMMSKKTKNSNNMSRCCVKTKSN